MPSKQMGAGVAASPHCPAAAGYQAWEARQSAGRFRSRVRAGGSYLTSGVLPVPEGAFRLPRGLPVRAEALAVRRSADPEPGSRLPPSMDPEPKLGSLSGRTAFGRSLSPASSPWTCVLGLRFRSSRAEARSCPTIRWPKPSPRRWQRADLRPAFCRTGPDRSPFLPLVPYPKVRDLWALHEACHFRFRSRTSPQLPHGGGFVSRPGLRSTASCLVGQVAASLRLWLGRLSTVAGRSSRPRIESCHES